MEERDVTAWLLGPKAEHASTWQELLGYVFDDYVNWRRNYFPEDPALISRRRRREHEDAIDELSGRLDSVVAALKADVPWYHPRYIAHMNSELTLPAMLGYFAGMLYNPNNVTSESAPVTVKLELEVGRLVAAMLGLDPARAWAHITSGGTIANLEALWAARGSQFTPLALRELSAERAPDLAVALAGGASHPLGAIDDDRLLLGLRPETALELPGRLTRALIDGGEDAESAAALVGHALSGGQYGIARAGYAAVAARLGLKPRVFVSAAAHYSIKKAANVLGYGEDAVRLIPVTERFRADVDALEQMVDELGPTEYVAAVIGVVGSTEEGAVDPVDEILALRERHAREADRSFWVHADAAYGGYVASVFRGLAVSPTPAGPDPPIESWIAAVDATEAVAPLIGEEPEPDVTWADPAVYAAYLALGGVDSITIDPHKLGYVPYPAGLVAFRDARVTDLLARKAPYLSEFGDSAPRAEAAPSTRRPPEDGPIHAVGPYILEGSKPGAAAVACWLAHTSIPLDASGHGRMVGQTLLSAAKLARYLERHRELYSELEAEAGAEPFTFLPIATPDTNIVCFVAAPMALEDGRLVAQQGELRRINALNRRLHSVIGGPDEGGMPYRHPFYVSRTEFGPEDYSAASIAPLLERLSVSAADYAANGLFVLRSVVMNPLYQLAEQEAGRDYLLDFVRELHAVARKELTALA